MKTDDRSRDIALWRYQVIAPLVALRGVRGSLKQETDRLAQLTYDHPLRGSIRLGRGTIEEWFYLHRNHGFEALMPRWRRDRGQSRRITDEIAEIIESLATDHPDLDGPGLLAEIDVRLAPDQRRPSLSTIYRFLRARGLDLRRRPFRRDHRAYAFEFAGECWQGDVMYGPAVPTAEGERRKTYLIAFIDDATRVVPHAQFYFEQHLRSLKDALKQALMKRGVPSRLYFDQGKIFRSRLLMHLAARLGIQLIHSRPYRPQGRAKIERWFRRVRQQFLGRADLRRLDDIDELNRQLWAWIEGDYHHEPHHGLEGEAPLERWVRRSENVRPLPEDVSLDPLFRDETTRRVVKDGTFSISGKRFEAGVRFIGQKITLRFDPFDLRRVSIVTDTGEEIDAFPVDLEGNRHIRRNPDPESPPPVNRLRLLALENLARERARRLRRDHAENPNPDPEETP